MHLIDSLAIISKCSSFVLVTVANWLGGGWLPIIECDCQFFVPTKDGANLGYSPAGAGAQNGSVK